MEFLRESFFHPMLQNPQQAMQHIFDASTDYYRSHLRHLFETYLIQPLSALASSSTSDLVSVLLLILILFVSLKVLDYARRIIVFWVIFVLRLLFLAGLIVGAIYVYRVGWEQAIAELSLLAGRFVDDFMNQSVAAGAGASGYAMYKGRYQGRPTAAWNKYGYGSRLGHQRGGGRAW